MAGGTLEQDEWLNRVFGVSVARQTPSRTARQVKSGPVPDTIPPPPRSRVPLGSGRPRSDTIIAPPPRPPVPREFLGDGGKRKLAVAKTAEGRVLFTSPPPPVREITFSGGGGKGVALPGAVKALEESHVLDEVTVVTGASVGSMTAALVAAGISADEFATVANDAETTGRIVEGTGGTKGGLIWAAMKNKATTGKGNPLTGDGLEKEVCAVMDSTVRKRVEEYLEACKKNDTAPDPSVASVLKEMQKFGEGPTFGHLRTLSKVIPKIKEVVITGTYTTELDSIAPPEQEDGKKPRKFKGENERGQLYVFSADTEPQLPVARAVHASASFPIAFKPVDIVLASGLKVRFIDGGVMNNTPTSSSIGNERKLDPVPESRGITFVFEDKDGEAKALTEGVASPGRGIKAAIADKLTGSSHIGAEYAKNRDAADRPEEVVVVPLKIRYQAVNKKGKTELRKVDMREGTLEFNLDDDAKIALQQATERETNAQINREQKPRTREFASDSQMFVSIGMSDLKTLIDSDYPGAEAAYEFRERVAEMLDKLHTAIAQARKRVEQENALMEPGRRFSMDDVLSDKNAAMALDELNTLAGDDVDFQGYVARSMNKGGLDELIAAARKGGRTSPVMEATYAVAEGVKAQAAAQNILKQVVYPKMRKEPKGGAGIETLLKIEDMLRKARTIDVVNAAIDIGVRHFEHKRDRRIPKRDHAQFAKDLGQWRQHAVA